MTTLIGVADLNKVKELLDAKGKTAYWLARQTNIPDKTIYALIKRDPLYIDEMTYGVIRRVSEALGVKPEDLRSDEDNI